MPPLGGPAGPGQLDPTALSAPEPQADASSSKGFFSSWFGSGSDQPKVSFMPSKNRHSIWFECQCRSGWYGADHIAKVCVWTLQGWLQLSSSV